MILSDRDILKRIRNKSIIVSPFVRKNLQPSTLDVRLAREIRVFNNYEVGLIDVKKPVNVSRTIKLKRNGEFVLHPGEFILGSTVEKIALPDDIAAKIEGRSSLGRLGLIIHATAGYIDPGFSGFITLEISNISRLPIRLYAGMRIGQISFIKMSSPVMNPYGSKTLGSKYQNQEGPTASKVWKDFEK
jgi:dCTP deaminase